MNLLRILFDYKIYVNYLRSAFELIRNRIHSILECILNNSFPYYKNILLFFFYCEYFRWWKSIIYQIHGSGGMLLPFCSLQRLLSVSISLSLSHVHTLSPSLSFPVTLTLKLLTHSLIHSLIRITWRQSTKDICKDFQWESNSSNVNETEFKINKLIGAIPS